jgi:preprotein translocase subunit SecG
MIKTTLVILAVFIVPGVVMGVISSYRAGQRPHRDVYLRFKKFAQRK